MRPGVTIALTAVDRRRLGAIVGNRNVPQKHAWRAEIVLLTADGLGTVEIMRRTGKSKTCVWRWQERFAAEGVDGLLRDKTRPSRVPPLGQEVIDRVVALTATEPPHEATHWTAAAMAKAAGISISSVQRIWKAHGLAPHCLRHFKLSRDPDFVPKLRDIVGLYVDPPAHAVVLSVDEKSHVWMAPGLQAKSCSSWNLIGQLASGGWSVRLSDCDQAAINFSLASGVASRKVCIGVLPKHQRP